MKFNDDRGPLARIDDRGLPVRIFLLMQARSLRTSMRARGPRSSTEFNKNRHFC
jgi:hypothetical protein